MKVFISWSKPASHQLALVLKDWLPDVIQQVDPWVSSEDIDKGQRWAAEVGTQLEGLTEGLLCVTAQNQHEPWLNFEAGALAKSVGQSRVRPVLLGLRPSDVTPPLGQFQATVATDRGDMYKLFQSLNRSCGPQLDERRLESAFGRVWDDYLGKISKIETGGARRTGNDARPPDDMIREILDIVRGISRSNEVIELSPPMLSSNNPSRKVRRVNHAHGTVEPGQRVIHGVFGPGTVLDIPFGVSSDAMEVVVRFDEHGLLAVGLAGLKPALVKSGEE